MALVTKVALFWSTEDKKVRCVIGDLGGGGRLWAETGPAPWPWRLGDSEGRGGCKTVQRDRGLDQFLFRTRSSEANPSLDSGARNVSGRRLEVGRVFFLQGNKPGCHHRCSSLAVRHCSSMEWNGNGDGSFFFFFCDGQPSTRRLEKDRGVGARTKTEQGSGTRGGVREGEG